MFQRSLVGLAVVLALVAAVLQHSAPALAASHCDRIYAVMRGTGGDDTIQYIEIRMEAAGQNAVSGTQLNFFDAAGNSLGSFTLTHDVTNGASGSSILIASIGFASVSNITPDFVLSTPVSIQGASGKIQFAGAANSNCAGTGTIIDSVAFGAYTGPVDCGTPAVPITGIPISGIQALTLNDTNQTCTNNSTEYAMQAAAPRNNAGQVGGLPDYGLACSPTTVTASQSSPYSPPALSPTSTCTVTSLINYNAPVNLSCTGLPAGATCGFSPNPDTPPANGTGSTTLTVTASPSLAVGSYPFQVVGAGGADGSLAHTAGMTLVDKLADADGDGVPDVSDNCPYWANPTQALPAWSTTAAPNDPDCDGFSNTVETYAGTNASLQCGANSWPPDFNSSGKVDLTDVVMLKPHFGSTSGFVGTTYSPAQYLAADTDAVQTSVTVSGTAIMNGQTIQIDNEQMKVTAGGGTTSLTVVRAYNGTAAAAHLSNGSTKPIYYVAYDRRFDLNADGQITLTDVILLKPYFNKTCS